MTCPGCGRTLPDGIYLCEYCGAEIKIVPDFVPELETSITESLSGIVMDLDPDGESGEGPEEKTEPEMDPARNTENEDAKILEEDFFRDRTGFLLKKPSAAVLIVLAAVVLILLGGLFFAGKYFIETYSYSWQLKMTDEYEAKGDYDRALSYLVRAKKLKGQDNAMIFREAELCEGAGYMDQAISIIEGAIADRPLKTAEKEAFYRKLIELYEKEEDYEKIHELLLGVEDENIRALFAGYVSERPSFSFPTGTYTDMIELSIGSNGKGRIYYTLDGTKPSMEHGTLYTNPIILRAGEYEVEAVYYNEHNIESDVAKAFYLIGDKELNEPSVKPESGDFDHPFQITVENTEGVSVYYTKDGTTPSPENGTLYEKPINAEMGLSNYTFVAADENGNVSPPVRRSYNMYLGNVIPIPNARALLAKRLEETGKCADASGRLPEGWDGKDAWKTVVYLDVVDTAPGKGTKSYCYRFVGFVVDGLGNILDSSELYAVNAYTGECMQVINSQYLPI
ncbi:MAG: chitobiase/beta-hexosaminidase C-terminal domain-containing protein [Lachnospiraceae bacterium]|nr:chitobiase/beta-hexosaminidase C-terminal domain-containing protein [Lachnospiraceae bacterium]